MNIMQGEVSETSAIQEVGMEEVQSLRDCRYEEQNFDTKHQKETDEKNHRECGHSFKKNRVLKGLRPF